MKVWRHKTDGKLYTIEHVRPPKMTGSWFEAIPYKWEGKKFEISGDYENQFELVSEGNSDIMPGFPSGILRGN